MESIETKIQEEYSDAMSPFERIIKRIFDVFVALVGIIVLFPLFVIIYVIIWFTGGEAIYKQKRIGYKGKSFNIYKFRTMYKDAEKNGIPRTEEERREQMTCVGRFLRDYHLDELPQLFNVVKGDMSFVGPRPERKVFIDKIMEQNPDYVNIYKMRPGLTSNATLYNGYTDTMEKMLIRLDMDLEYLTTRSLWGDFMIICKTAFAIISGKKI
jgi:lipopolysaccharide/colanic/teichoic acid biosynthesis glycosyltransferase